jgi:signal transduction histidine kinase
LRHLTGLRPWRNVRVRLLTILLVALVIALAASTYGFNVLFARTTSSSANSLLRARASSELSLISVRGGRITRQETTSDALADNLVWIFVPGGVAERPSRRTPLDAVAARIARTPGRRVDVGQSDVRLYAAPIVAGGKRQGTLVTGVSLAPYEQSERRALLGSLLLASVMLVLTAVAAWWLLKSALRPVVQMSEQAATWSELDLDRRFDQGPPHDELTLLAGKLDIMLDRIAASFRHERRFSAELSHELRTPLARMIAELELALRRDREPEEYRETLELGLRNANQLARIVESLVAAAEHEARGTRGTADAYEVAEGALGGVTHLAESRHVSLQAERPPQPLRLGLDGDLAERVLHPVVENACRYGATWARVRIERAGAKIAYVVEDDGPGVVEGEADTIFEPGHRGAAAGGSSGAGLGLALARRLARSASGDVVTRPGAGGCFIVTLPPA